MLILFYNIRKLFVNNDKQWHKVNTKLADVQPRYDVSSFSNISYQALLQDKFVITGRVEVGDAGNYLVALTEVKAPGLFICRR